METSAAFTFASHKVLGEELIKAVAVGDVARVQELIASGADVETRNPEVGPSHAAAWP
jgi:hypothetical protein